MQNLHLIDLPTIQGNYFMDLEKVEQYRNFEQTYINEFLPPDSVQKRSALRLALRQTLIHLTAADRIPQALAAQHQTFETILPLILWIDSLQDYQDYRIPSQDVLRNDMNIHFKEYTLRYFLSLFDRDSRGRYFEAIQRWFSNAVENLSLPFGVWRYITNQLALQTLTIRHELMDLEDTGLKMLNFVKLTYNGFGDLRPSTNLAPLQNIGPQRWSAVKQHYNFPVEVSKWDNPGVDIGLTNLSEFINRTVAQTFTAGAKHLARYFLQLRVRCKQWRDKIHAVRGVDGNEEEEEKKAREFDPNDRAATQEIGTQSHLISIEVTGDVLGNRKDLGGPGLNIARDIRNRIEALFREWEEKYKQDDDNVHWLSETLQILKFQMVAIARRPQAVGLFEWLKANNNKITVGCGTFTKQFLPYKLLNKIDILNDGLCLWESFWILKNYREDNVQKAKTSSLRKSMLRQLLALQVDNKAAFDIFVSGNITEFIAEFLYDHPENNFSVWLFYKGGFLFQKPHSLEMLVVKDGHCFPMQQSPESIAMLRAQQERFFEIQKLSAVNDKAADKEEHYTKLHDRQRGIIVRNRKIPECTADFYYLDYETFNKDEPEMMIEGEEQQNLGKQTPYSLGMTDSLGNWLGQPPDKDALLVKLKAIESSQLRNAELQERLAFTKVKLDIYTLTVEERHELEKQQLELELKLKDFDLEQLEQDADILREKLFGNYPFFGMDCTLKWLDWFDVEIIKKQKKSVFIAFNGSKFDYPILWKYLLQKYAGSVAMTGGYGNIKKITAGGKTAVFIDLRLALGGGSLNLWAKEILGRQKLDFTHAGVTLQKVEGDRKFRNKGLRYNIEDCDLERLVHQAFGAMLLEEGINKNDWTTATELSFRLFLNQMPKTLKIHGVSSQLYARMKGSYYGGIGNTLVNVARGRIVYLDINSCYPYVMQQYLYSIRHTGTSQFVDVRHEDASEIQENCLYQVLEFKWKDDTHIPFFPVRYENDTSSYKKGLYYPLHSSKISYRWGFEIQQGFECGWLEFVRTGIVDYFENQPIFKDYINGLYEKRVKAKKEGKKLLALLLKLQMNSLYGKFAQKMFAKTKWANAATALEIDISDIGPKLITDRKYFDDCVQYTMAGNQYSQEIGGCTQISSQVAARGRMQLIKMIVAICKKKHTVTGEFVDRVKKFIYMDTDSLILEIGEDEDLMKILEGIYSEDKLGYLKLEHELDFILALASKMYFAENTRDPEHTTYIAHLKGVHDELFQYEHDRMGMKEKDFLVKSGIPYERYKQMKETRRLACKEKFLQILDIGLVEFHNQCAFVRNFGTVKILKSKKRVRQWQKRIVHDMYSSSPIYDIEELDQLPDDPDENSN